MTVCTRSPPGTRSLSTRYSTASLCPPPPMATVSGRSLLRIAAINSSGVLIEDLGLAQNASGDRAILATGSRSMGLYFAICGYHTSGVTQFDWQAGTLTVCPSAGTVTK